MICTLEEKTWSSRIMKTRSRNRNRFTGKTFAHFWFHVRFLLVEGEKMSKSLGNFYTLRDLVLKGHKPSSIRYLLTSVPYRNQLNFTFDGLKQAAVSVERLRNFRQRLTAGSFPSGSCLEMQSLAAETIDRMKSALDDDLNTAQAQAALFEMVRSANAALDADGIKKDDVPPLLAALEKFDEIFAVLKDDDVPKMKQVFDWAPLKAGKKTSARNCGRRCSPANSRTPISKRKSPRW